MSFVINDNFPEEICWVKTTFQTLAEHRQKEKQQKKNKKKVPVINFDVMEKFTFRSSYWNFCFFSGKSPGHWWKDEIRSLCCIILAVVLSAAYFFHQYFSLVVWLIKSSSVVMNCVPVFHSVCLLSISIDNHEKKCRL